MCTTVRVEGPVDFAANLTPHLGHGSGLGIITLILVIAAVDGRHFDHHRHRWPPSLTPQPGAWVRALSRSYSIAVAARVEWRRYDDNGSVGGWAGAGHPRTAESCGLRGELI